LARDISRSFGVASDFAYPGLDMRHFAEHERSQTLLQVALGFQELAQLMEDAGSALRFQFGPDTAPDAGFGGGIGLQGVGERGQGWRFFGFILRNF
jgi:hypothetical protein